MVQYKNHENSSTNSHCNILTDRQTESNCNTHYAEELTRLTKSALFSQLPVYQMIMHIKIFSSFTITVSPHFSRFEGQDIR